MPGEKPPAETGEQKRVQTKYGVAFQNDKGEWRFQWNASRAGQPPECALVEAGSRLPDAEAKIFFDEINGALKKAGESIVVAGGRISPRDYLG